MFKVTGSLLGILKYQSDRGRLLWTAAGGGGSPILQVTNIHYTDVDSVQGDLSKVTWPDNDTGGPENSQASLSQGDNSRA